MQARNPATFWARLLVALAGILLSVGTLGMNFGVATTRLTQGQEAFRAVSIAAFVLCCASGFMVVAGISQQRKDGALGLLFLTSVKPWEVLAAAFGATGISFLCNLVALVPLVVIPLVAGGVTLGEAARMVLVLFDTMGVSIAAGLWASTAGRGWVNAARTAALLLISILAVPMLFRMFGSGVLLRLAWISPICALEFVADNFYRRFPRDFWMSLAVIHGISWLLFFLAGARLANAMRGQDEPGVKTLKPKRRQGRTRADWEDPIQWEVRRQGGMRAAVWAVVILSALYESNLARFSWGSLRMPLGGGMSLSGVSIALQVLQVGTIGWVASRYFLEARRNGDLELLLTTPVGARNIVAAQWAVLWRMLFWPLAVLIFATHSRSAFYLWQSASQSRRKLVIYGKWRLPDFTFFILGQSLLLCANKLTQVASAVWLGLYLGYSAGSQTKVIARIIVLAWFVPFASLALLRSVAATFLGPAVSFTTAMIWIAAQICYCATLIVWAKRRLSAELHLTHPIAVPRGRPSRSLRSMLCDESPAAGKTG